ncbi:MAG: cobalamin-dependent protein [Deltaproteobacteria bacterium]|nr:cobalamin-dependent protein [Deltaproteobacteria bacterium]
MTTKAVLVTMAGYPMVPSNFMPDNGLAQLAACLVDKGHDVRIIDLNTTETMDRLFPEKLRDPVRQMIEAKMQGELSPEDTHRLEELEKRITDHRDAEFGRMGEELALDLRSGGVTWVGFKLWNGDGFSGSNKMAKAVRRAMPDLPIIAGGSHVDFFGDFLLEVETGFQYFSCGEGEETVTAFAEFVEGRRDINRVPNLFFSKNGKTIHTETSRIKNLNALPLPLYDPDVYPALGTAGKLRMGVYEETRGCPHRCAFCNHPLKAGHNMREKNIDDAVDDIMELKRRHGFNAFRLGGSYTPSKYMRRFAQRLIEKKAGIEFCGYGRISDARNADFERFYRAGCRALFFGVESGNQLLLDRVNKGYKTKHCSDILRASRNAGIFTIASLIYPNPGETIESRKETLSLLEEIQPDGVPIHFPMLLPGSQWWAEPERFGFQVPDRAAYLHSIVAYKARLLFPPQFWPEMLYRIDEKSFSQFARETSEMTREIEDMGIATLVSDETALIALHAGLDVKRFRDDCRWIFSTGNADGIQQVIDRFNEG